MASSKPSNHSTATSEYSNIVEAQENNHKSNCTNMIEVLNEEKNKSKTFRETQTNNWRKGINPLKKPKKNKQLMEMSKTVHYLKMEKE